MQTVCPLLEPIRREKGCMSYRIFVDATDQNASLLVGEWQTQNDWTNHLRSKDHAILMGAITVLGVPNCVESRLLYAVPVLATLS
jgi:quinol monooxygenase YgiN